MRGNLGLLCWLFAIAMSYLTPTPGVVAALVRATPSALMRLCCGLLAIRVGPTLLQRPHAHPPVISRTRRDRETGTQKTVRLSTPFASSTPCSTSLRPPPAVSVRTSITPASHATPAPHGVVSIIRAHRQHHREDRISSFSPSISPWRRRYRLRCRRYRRLALSLMQAPRG
ncbi:hypothetical protein PLICRDRAFT_313491 [Plicaturopsis crispa FD-325 SS-3]|nr:hypothetical protein PLICRDRAFT_313491 [Plicaturopsis crispa FD-325 SS-3]